MADRFPLIFNTNADQIQELAASDNLDLASSNLTNVANVDVAGLSTFAGISTFSNNVFIDGTLTAGLIDGGEY